LPDPTHGLTDVASGRSNAASPGRPSARSPPPPSPPFITARTFSGRRGRVHHEPLAARRAFDTTLRAPAPAPATIHSGRSGGSKGRPSAEES